MTMPSGGPYLEETPPRSRTWVGWVVTFGVLVVVGLIAWSFVMNFMANAPEPSVTPTTPPALADVDGRWCTTDPAQEVTCVTVALPSVMPDDAPELERFVLPEGAEPEDGPATFEYDVAANLGECWRTGLMGTETVSALTFTYCPAGATSGDAGLDLSDSSVDRLFITQDAAPLPYLRADEEPATASGTSGP